VIGARLRVASLVVSAVGLLAGPAVAQELTGVALGPDGQPIPGAPVALHRVGGDGGGAFVGSATTDATGAFRFEIEADSAVYFAAIRYEDRMYIGPAVQPGTVPIRDYVIEVDPANEAGAVASALSGQRQVPPPQAARSTPADSDTGALLLVGLLALAAAAVFFFAAPRYRRRRTRETLIELAAIENALEDAADGDDTARLLADRDRLRGQLAPRP
jgi:hypothetical protein